MLGEEGKFFLFEHKNLSIKKGTFLCAFSEYMYYLLVLGSVVALGEGYEPEP